jgi:hypothetical protein
MPQNNVIAAWKNNYALMAPWQKPGNVTVSTTLPAYAVPNKAPWSTPTVQGAEVHEKLPQRADVTRPIALRNAKSRAQNGI